MDFCTEQIVFKVYGRKWISKGLETALILVYHDVCLAIEVENKPCEFNQEHRRLF